MEKRKRPGTIHRTVYLLEKALSQLHADLSPRDIERIAVMVHRGMSRRQRTFHTPEHIFALADPSDPHGTLAALFHDLVYYQVDDGFEPEVETLLQPFVVFNPDRSLALASGAARDARAFHGCLAVFGFQQGQQLSPFGGLNEFLSALVMGLLFEGIIADPDLLIATACIEATIPFRKPDTQHRFPAELLRDRLNSTVASMRLDLEKKDLDEAVVRAVAFANRDVENFAEEDVGRFLDNTWKLLPETNPELRFVGVYTIRSYRSAVQKMRGFLVNLEPECVFQRFKEEPAPENYRRLLELTRRNLNAAGTYLGVKLLAATILEALASLTGGDAPVALFMGEIGTSEQLADYLPPVPDNADGPLDNTVYRLLDQGRTSAAGFDLQNAPLSLFVYRSIGTENLEEAIEAAQAMCAGTSEPTQFLDALPRTMVTAIANAAAHMVPTRKTALEAIATGT